VARREFSFYWGTQTQTGAGRWARKKFEQCAGEDVSTPWKIGGSEKTTVIRDAILLSFAASERNAHNVKTLCNEGDWGIVKLKNVYKEG